MIKQHADRVAAILRKNIEDLDATVEVVQVSSIMGSPIWSIQVKLNDVTLAFSPTALDNGAHGIHLNPLAQIRRAAGEDVADRAEGPDRPGKYFADVMSIE